MKENWREHKRERAREIGSDRGNAANEMDRERPEKERKEMDTETNK